MLGHMFQAQSPQASSSLFHLSFYKEEMGPLLFASMVKLAMARGNSTFMLRSYLCFSKFFLQLHDLMNPRNTDLFYHVESLVKGFVNTMHEAY